MGALPGELVEIHVHANMFSMQASTDASGPTADANITLLLDLGRVLQRHGVPSRRIEEVLTDAGIRLGVSVQVFASLTALLITFGPAEHLRTTFLRFEPAEVDLGAVARLHEVVHCFLDGSRTPEETRAALASMKTRPLAAPAWARSASAAVGSAGWCGLLGGHARDAASAVSAALLIELFAIFVERHHRFTREFLAVAGLIAGLTITLMSTRVPLLRELAILGAVLPFLPGLALVTAAEELASKDLVTGTARIVAASLVFAQLVFGVAVGVHLGSLVTPPLPAVPPRTWPLSMQALMLLPALLGLAVRLRADFDGLGWFLLAGLASFSCGRVAGNLFGPELGAFLGAFIIGLIGNGTARLWHRPTLLTVVPGTLVLVPGALGFRSANALSTAHALEGVQIGFAALMVAVAIATGLMLASSVLPPRRAL